MFVWMNQRDRLTWGRGATLYWSVKKITPTAATAHDNKYSDSKHVIFSLGSRTFKCLCFNISHLVKSVYIFQHFTGKNFTLWKKNI